MTNSESGSSDARNVPVLTDGKSAAARVQREILRLSRVTPTVLALWMTRHAEGDYFTLPDPDVIVRAFTRLGQQMLRHPDRVLESHAKLWGAYAEMWQHSMWPGLARQEPPGADSQRTDRRFKAAGWTKNPGFDLLRRSYLVTRDEVMDAVRDFSADLEEQDRAQVVFYAGQMVDALAPSNFPQLNPEVLEETASTGGENLLHGLGNLLEDIARGRGLLRVRQTEPDAFELGRNIATTPGKVVYQNDLMQLIQYSPTTETVDRRPLLIVPPWINKYYILDLTPKKSFIQWAVDGGLTVFVVSWVNPDASYADVAFDDYMSRGPLEALDAIERATGEREVNAIGYCIGGTLLACTLAYMAATGDDRIRSATYFTSLLDFSDVGQLSVFIDEEQIQFMEREMAGRGYLEGNHLANAFNMLQSKDLIWSFVVNNYLLGRDPAAFDLLFWNSDSTRMPYRMQSFYLRNMYLNNRLRVPGGITLAGHPIDLYAIRVPSYFLATQRDHIAPWTSCYRSALLPGGRKRFVLGGSGHIAGVINPEGSGKYGYWTNADPTPDTPEEWLESAQYHSGSWWPDWRHWLKPHGGGEAPARQPGGGELVPIEDAPGSYVRVRVDAD